MIRKNRVFFFKIFPNWKKRDEEVKASGRAFSGLNLVFLACIG